MEGKKGASFCIAVAWVMMAASLVVTFHDCAAFCDHHGQCNKMQRLAIIEQKCAISWKHATKMGKLKHLKTFATRTPASQFPHIPSPART